VIGNKKNDELKSCTMLPEREKYSGNEEKGKSIAIENILRFKSEGGSQNGLRSFKSVG
jgi:hypothetical protein